MKRITTLFLLLCLLLTALPGAALATEEAGEETEAVADTTEVPEETLPQRQPGQCGEDMTWSCDGGVLTISGNGSMDDYPGGDAPWLSYKESITAIVFTGNVTYVGEGAFTDYDKLEAVDFGSAMHTIGVAAFKSCDGLTSITLPASFRRFGKECFMSCANLEQIVCQGGMPSFNANCVWDTYATIYYPTNNPWPAEHVLQLTQAFQNRIQFRMGTPDGQSTAAIPTTAPTEAVTEPETTLPETTEPETVPETQPSTEPETREQTLPETTEAAAAQTEPAPRKHLGSMNGIAVFGILLAGVISFFLIGALIFRRRSRYE